MLWIEGGAVLVATLIEAADCARSTWGAASAPDAPPIRVRKRRRCMTGPLLGMGVRRSSSNYAMGHATRDSSRAGAASAELTQRDATDDCVRRIRAVMHGKYPARSSNESEVRVGTAHQFVRLCPPYDSMLRHGAIQRSRR